MIKVFLLIFILCSCNVYDLVDGDIKVSKAFEQAVRSNTNASGLLVSSSGTSFSFGPQVLGSSSAIMISISNNGVSDATSVAGVVSGAEFHFEGGSYPGIMGTCGTIIMSMETCDISVEFNPASSGNYSGSVQLSYSDGQAGQSLNLALTGTSNLPAIFNIISPHPLVFNDTATGASSTEPIIISNDGQTQGTFNYISSSGATEFSVVGGSLPGTCNGILDPGTQCTFDLGFNPTSVDTYNGNVEINYFDGVSTAVQNLAVSGDGV